jgi:hypothetical protein
MAALPSDLLDSLARVYARAAVEEYLTGVKSLGVQDRGAKSRTTAAKLSDRDDDLSSAEFNTSND